MAAPSQHPIPIPTTHAVDAGFAFLRARRAQNLSVMRLAEQSLRALAAASPSGAPVTRVWLAQAALVRDTASVYRSFTAHLAP